MGGPGSYPCDNTHWDFGNGVFKLSSTLSIVQQWTPDNGTQSWCELNLSDADIGSLGPALLPNNTIFQTGKSGYGWLLNSTPPGGFNGHQFQGPGRGGRGPAPDRGFVG